MIHLDTNVLVALLYGETTQEEWLLAGGAFRAYAQRRRRSGGGQPRRLLMDFLIGAHAARRAQTLLTMDPQHYRQSFPGLNVIDPVAP